MKRKKKKKKHSPNHKLMVELSVFPVSQCEMPTACPRGHWFRAVSWVMFGKTCMRRLAFNDWSIINLTDTHPHIHKPFKDERLFWKSLTGITVDSRRETGSLLPQFLERSCDSHALGVQCSLVCVPQMCG